MKCDRLQQKFIVITHNTFAYFCETITEGDTPLFGTQYSGGGGLNGTQYAKWSNFQQETQYTWHTRSRYLGVISAFMNLNIDFGSSKKSYKQAQHS